MRRFFSLLAVGAFALGTVGCSEEGSMEKAGRAMDDAIEDAHDAASDTLEDAGEKLDEAGEKAKKMAEGQH
jgi:hypothetical protein